MAHKPARNYANGTKYGVGLGFGLLLIGVLGQIIAPKIQGTLPDWELSLFIWVSVAGILVALFSVFLFGVALPLIE